MNKRYNRLLDNIRFITDDARKQAYNYVNSILVKTYWEIGRVIVEYEQQGQEKASYGSKLLEKLSSDLKFKCGKGFSKSNLVYMRLFYIKYRKSETLSHQLSWSHYFELLKIDDDLERSFYEKQCILEKWSNRELKRQKNSALFYRLTLSKNKQEIKILSRKGQIIQRADDLVKDPYVLEFLGLSDAYSEKELEQKIIDNLQMFLLELGKGFTFVGRQYRITLGNNHYYVDLVFYHRLLKCFVLIDLKIGGVTHSDIGQMNTYLNYFRFEECKKGENPPIGIVLAAEKDNIEIKYALGGISNRLFVSKYKLYLPTEEELKKELEKS
jgi:predicted nuclease of restriction endonuclease-like (RecB) superfamily